MSYITIVRYKKCYFERKVAKLQRRKEKLKVFVPIAIAGCVYSFV